MGCFVGLGIASYVVYGMTDLPAWANWFMWSHLASLTLLGLVLGVAGNQSQQEQFNFSKMWTFTVLCPWVAFLNPIWWIIFWVVYGLIRFVTA
jgi:hypothetical protein